MGLLNYAHYASHCSLTSHKTQHLPSVPQEAPYSHEQYTLPSSYNLHLQYLAPQASPGPFTLRSSITMEVASFLCSIISSRRLTRTFPFQRLKKRASLLMALILNSPLHVHLQTKNSPTKDSTVLPPLHLPLPVPPTPKVVVILKVSPSLY
ncbi:hypothetical protein E2C01_085667 [Portunus trituberculatus]|uniref:Uncharacterized protein n=1 Tax=Portunus trituberculatus TaxID=210409 RepID=A0A5B7J1M2_PORTR|nr:hypothetical protein [Portunus trituberculatus]